MQRQLLVDASFSQQSTAWRPMNKPAFVQMQWIDDPTQARDGFSFLRVRVTQPGGSVAQDVPEGGRAGASYCFGLWLRAATGSTGPVPVALTMGALGGIQEHASTPTSVGAEWTFVTVALDLTSDHSSIRAELSINQADASIDMVHAELSINQADASINMDGGGLPDFVPGEVKDFSHIVPGKSPGDKEPSGKEFGEKEPGDKEPSDKEPGDKEFGEKELGDKEPGDKEPGSKDFGDKEPSGKEFGDKEPGEKEPGDKEPSNKEQGDKEPGDKEPGEKEPGDKEAEIIIDGSASIFLEHGPIKTSQSRVLTRAEDGVLHARSPHV